MSFHPYTLPDYPFAAHFSNLFYAAATAANASKLREYTSAITIQRCFRGYLGRRYVNYLHGQATTIQRVFRGHLGRRRAYIMRIHANAAFQLSLYHCAAIKIQKLIRGFLSRRIRLDFYGRKRFLSYTKHKGMEMDNYLLDTYERLMSIEMEDRQEKKEKEFKQLTGNLHHLLSTQRVPGVFNVKIHQQTHANNNANTVQRRTGDMQPPSQSLSSTGSGRLVGPVYQQEFQPLTVNSIPVESYIRQAFQERQRELKKKRAEIDRRGREVESIVEREVNGDSGSGSGSNRNGRAILPPINQSQHMTTLFPVQSQAQSQTYSNSSNLSQTQRAQPTASSHPSFTASSTQLPRSHSQSHAHAHPHPPSHSHSHTHFHTHSVPPKPVMSADPFAGPKDLAIAAHHLEPAYSPTEPLSNRSLNSEHSMQEFEEKQITPSKAVSMSAPIHASGGKHSAHIGLHSGRKKWQIGHKIELAHTEMQLQQDR